MVHAVFHEGDGALEELLADERRHDVLHLLRVSHGKTCGYLRCELLVQVQNFRSEHLSLHNETHPRAQTFSTLNFLAFKSEMICAFVLAGCPVAGYFARIRPIKPRDSSEKHRAGIACRDNPE